MVACIFVAAVAMYEVPAWPPGYASVKGPCSIPLVGIRMAMYASVCQKSLKREAACCIVSSFFSKSSYFFLYIA